MIKSLFILGAGASKDFSDIFPTGLELIKEINYHFFTEENLSRKNGEGDYLSALMNTIVDIFPDESENGKKQFSKIKNALWKMQVHYETEYLDKKNIPRLTIDSFVLEQVKDGNFIDIDGDIVKCCIYYLIKGFEHAKIRQKSFERNSNYDLASKVSEFEANEIIDSLSFVTFNYDRILEHYFCNYLMNEKIFNENDKDQFLKNNVHHVYGSLGSLAEVPFDLANNCWEKIKKFYGNIKLIEKDSKHVVPVKDPERVNKVHFLGSDTIRLI